MMKGIAGTTVLARRHQASERIQLHSFAKLLGWLRASGEFEQESRRLGVWLDFLRGLPDSAGGSRDMHRYGTSSGYAGTG
ncbi:hypothetical protein [Paenibacillus riograndensis]|uniref:hypothetical protein n=1 Tax=Paenibacillus riograndensis TaxID=483937 RepID=UPI0014289CB5|nr:hypothetical protein [Paenibacillus riograndensis]